MKEFDFLVNIIRMKLTCFEGLKSENIGVQIIYKNSVLLRFVQLQRLILFVYILESKAEISQS